MELGGILRVNGLMATATTSIAYAILVWAIWLAVSQFLALFRTKSLIRNLPTLNRKSFLVGNLNEVFHPASAKWNHEVTRKYGGALQIHGMLGDEQIYVTDPRALHKIIIKEQDVFEKPPSSIAVINMVLGEGVLGVLGDQHRKQRKTLNPVFHIKHMRKLIPIFCQVADKCRSAIELKLRSGRNQQEIDVLEWTSRMALEFVGQAGFGSSFDSLVDGEKCTYTTVVKDLVPTLSRLRIPLLIVPIIFKHVPASISRSLARVMPTYPAQDLRRITDFMDKTSHDVLEQKKCELGTMDDSVRDEREIDILSVLLRANSKVSENERLSDREVVGNMTTLIFAAQDTTSSALSRILHTLCLYPDAQGRLREEVYKARSTKAEGEVWVYDEINELPYLDAVCRETLRLHSPVSWMARIAQRPTILPLLRPIVGTDGQLIDAVPIAKNQKIIIGIAAANRDEATWGPDAHQWKPERWMNRVVPGDDATLGVKDELSDTLGTEAMKEAKLPGAYSGMMTFSGGGSGCIGFKFALLEMKVVLAMLIEKFEFALPDGEIVWNMTNIQTPMLKGKENATPHLPLKVSLAK